MFKPRLFVGSSGKSLSIAYAVQENLDPVADVTVWDQGMFSLSTATLEALLQALGAFDCGAFIFSPDDILSIRGDVLSAARDNVVFELGLFIGRLGRARSYIILPQQHDSFRIPTDLLGVTMATFDSERADNNLLAALAPACNKIQREIARIRHPVQRTSLTTAVDRLISEPDDLFATIAEHVLNEHAGRIALGRVEYDISKSPQVLRSSIDISAGKVSAVSFLDCVKDFELWRGRRMESYRAFNASIARRAGVTFTRTFVLAAAVMRQVIWSDFHELLEEHLYDSIVVKVVPRSDVFNASLGSKDLVLVNHERLHIHAPKAEVIGRYTTATLVVDKPTIQDTALQISRLEDDAFTWPEEADRIEALFR